MSTINLGPYTVDKPTATEQQTILDSLGIKSAASLVSTFVNATTLRLTDSKNSSNSVTIVGGTQLEADRLRVAKTFSVSGDATAIAQSFDGTANVVIPITIGNNAITAAKLASSSVINAKIAEATIGPEKLSVGAPSWNASETAVSQTLNIGKSRSSAGASTVNFYSSHPTAAANASITLVNAGDLTITNTSNVVVNGLRCSADASQTVFSTRQRIGNLLLFDNQICSAASLEINRSDSSAASATDLSTTIFDGKNNAISRFTAGASRNLETFGPVRSITSASQISADTAGLQSRASIGNACISLLTANSGILLRHVANSTALEIRNNANSALADLSAATIASSTCLVSNSTTPPRLVLQDSVASTSAILQTSGNNFSIFSGGSGGIVPSVALASLEINLATRTARFDADVNAASFTSRSSIRYKKHVAPIEHALQNVSLMQGVSYVWKDTNRADIGLIAEDVDKIYPELVSKNADDSIQGIDYGKLSAVLIEAVKELSARVAALEEKISKG